MKPANPQKHKLQNQHVRRNWQQKTGLTARAPEAAAPALQLHQDAPLVWNTLLGSPCPPSCHSLWSPCAQAPGLPAVGTAGWQGAVLASLVPLRVQCVWFTVVFPEMNGVYKQLFFQFSLLSCFCNKGWIS